MPVAFDEVVEKVNDAARQVEADQGASPVLVAVVREFQAKLEKAEARTSNGEPNRDSVMELEQAGDSAKAAAEADTGVSGDVRDSVLAAHLAIPVPELGRIGVEPVGAEANHSVSSEETTAAPGLAPSLPRPGTVPEKSR